jgi:hypothetical protein
MLCSAISCLETAQQLSSHISLMRFLYELGWLIWIIFFILRSSRSKAISQQSPLKRFDRLSANRPEFDRRFSNFRFI